MPRPTTKDQLITAMQAEHDALEQALTGLTPEQLSTSSPITHCAIKDVLAHIWEWEQMCLSWHKAGLKGLTPAVPGEGFIWSQLPALNKQIYEKHRDRPLDEVLKEFRRSYQQMLKTIPKISEEDLFEPGRYAWTKTSTLGAYFVSATSSHYVWARKEIRKCLKGML
ncbi:MAG: ClbS/DfsB family four-helix bundle protein [Anaerolineae bacterium]|jgi:hypothetical protein|nr:ClbS/DfsB family four-helix bundle protein [Anaerolineae bacterium]